MTKEINSSFFRQFNTPQYKGKEVTFQEIIKKDIGKVQFRSSGNGRLYQTGDVKLIGEFNSAMEKTTYVQSGHHLPIVGGSPPGGFFFQDVTVR